MELCFDYSLMGAISIKSIIVSFCCSSGWTSIQNMTFQNEPQKQQNIYSILSYFCCMVAMLIFDRNKETVTTVRKIAVGSICRFEITQNVLQCLRQCCNVPYPRMATIEWKQIR